VAKLPEEFDARLEAPCSALGEDINAVRGGLLARPLHRVLQAWAMRRCYDDEHYCYYWWNRIEAERFVLVR
jgi:hypothetical protein